MHRVYLPRSTLEPAKNTAAKSCLQNHLIISNYFNKAKVKTKDLVRLLHWHHRLSDPLGYSRP